MNTEPDDIDDIDDDDIDDGYDDDHRFPQQPEPTTDATLEEWRQQARKHHSQGLGIRVNTTALADWLGVSKQAVSKNLIEKQHLEKDAHGYVQLFDAVNTYCRTLRGLAKARPPKSNVETEMAQWKLENIKLQNKEWRMRRDREIINALLDDQRAQLVKLKSALDGNASARKAIDRYLAALKQTDADAISMQLEDESGLEDLDND